MKSRSLGAICVALVLLSGSLARRADALTIKVLARQRECVTENVAAGTLLNIAFTVTHGGKLDIDASATAKLQDQFTHEVRSIDLQTWKLTTDGHLEFRAPKENANGASVTICFINEMARFTPKWIAFEFYKMPPDHVDQQQLAIDSQHAETSQTKEMELEGKLHSFANQIYNMRVMKQKIRSTEERHRDMVESTSSWLMFGSVADAVLLVVMSLFQFWYLKRFLSVKGLIMRSV